jgi:hypothetical protein
VERFEVPLIEQPPVNPLENEMVLGLVKPQATVYQQVQSLLAKAAGCYSRNLS